MFLFYNTDFYENRAHVHVGKKGSQDLCKIWLGPKVEMYSKGEFTDSQVKEILELAENNNDMAQEGYWGVTPKIKSVEFPARGKFQVNLEDGRIIIMPVSAFPSLKKVPVKDRCNWYLIGGGVSWDTCPEVIHIEQILGNWHNYAHER